MAVDVVLEEQVKSEEGAGKVVVAAVTVAVAVAVAVQAEVAGLEDGLVVDVVMVVVISPC